MEIYPNIHNIVSENKTGQGITNAYLVTGTTGSVLIDTGWKSDEQSERIINYINNSLYKLESIRLDSELYNEYMKKTNDLINKILSKGKSIKFSIRLLNFIGFLPTLNNSTKLIRNVLENSDFRSGSQPDIILRASRCGPLPWTICS